MESIYWFVYLEHGGWSEWGSWQPFDRPCGSAKSVRQRKCDNPVPKYRGRLCPPTESIQIRRVSLTECIRKSIYFLVGVSLLIYGGRMCSQVYYRKVFPKKCCRVFWKVPGLESFLSKSPGLSAS